MAQTLRMQRAAGSCRALPCRPRVAAHSRLVVRAVQTVEARAAQEYQFINPAWSQVSNEQQFMGILHKLVDAGKCPPQLLAVWQDFYENYQRAVFSSGRPEPEATLLAAKVQATIADGVFNQFVDPFTFPSFHKRLLEPYNYYEFGQRYVGTLTDFDNSVLGYPERWDTIQAQLAAGHNVVLLANHQTEADPGVFAHMLEHTHPNLATDVVYVAGDRVVMDVLCKPFSMGRNLFCVHSKKRMDDIPELKASKMETNRKTLVAMSRAFNAGGCLVWIAPSGGRDRPDPDGHTRPDPFDPSAVDLMRSLLARAKQPGHIYPMAMYSWPMMPPPKELEKNLGERRITNWTPVGISVCEELVPEQLASGDEMKAQQAGRLADKAWHAVHEEYAQLERAILEPAFRDTSPQYTQPWRK